MPYLILALAEGTGSAIPYQALFPAASNVGDGNATPPHDTLTFNFGASAFDNNVPAGYQPVNDALGITTMDPTNTGSGLTLIDGNLGVQDDIVTGGWDSSRATNNITTGKIVWEVTYTGTFVYGVIGIASNDFPVETSTWLGQPDFSHSFSVGYKGNDGTIYINDGSTVAGNPTFSIGDTIMIALDLVSTQPTIKFYRSNVELASVDITPPQ
jgi:hypothetical protein